MKKISHPPPANLLISRSIAFAESELQVSFQLHIYAPVYFWYIYNCRVLRCFSIKWHEQLNIMQLRYRMFSAMIMANMLRTYSLSSEAVIPAFSIPQFRVNLCKNCTRYQRFPNAAGHYKNWRSLYRSRLLLQCVMLFERVVGGWLNGVVSIERADVKGVMYSWNAKIFLRIIFIECLACVQWSI